MMLRPRTSFECDLKVIIYSMSTYIATDTYETGPICNVSGKLSDLALVDPEKSTLPSICLIA